jgi:hypothetical protein
LKLCRINYTSVISAKVGIHSLKTTQIIVAAGISEQLLRWKEIEAKLKISESKNTKVVIIESGKDGLPVILDTK